MPNRIIRDGILDSRAVNALSDDAELFYRRLMSVVDDYGRYEADPELLLVKCFPRKLKEWTVIRLTDACQMTAICLTDDGHPLVTFYFDEASGKKYLQINKFQQRIRAEKSKFPSPEGCLTVMWQSDDGPLHASRARTTTTATTTATATATATTAAEIQKTDPPKNGPRSSVQDDGFQRFDDLCAVAGLSRAPSDLERSRLAWRNLDFEQRLAAVQGIQARIDVGEYEPGSGFLPLAHNYLEQHRWERPVRDKRKKAAVPETKAAWDWPEMDDSWKNGVDPVPEAQGK